MKSSKKSKTNVDDISRETQRLVKDSHVCLPYHKPKQKSLKDFLNRQKITPENRASLTGSKKLLKKAWELIENKERNVEKFYNEDSIEENTVTSSCDDIQVEKTISLNDDDCDDNNDEDDNNISYNKGKCMSLELSDEEKNINSSSDEENAKENKFSTNYSDDENSNQSKSSEETPSQQSNNDNSNNLELENLEDDSSDLKDAVVNQFIDDEAESSDLDCSSDENDRPDFIDNSEDEEEDISKKKKRRIVLLSESSDEEDLNSDVNFKSDNLISITDEPAINMSTQQLMDLCSGQFQTQLSGAQEDHSDQELEDDFDSEVPLDETKFNENEDDELTSSKNFKKDFEPDILQSDDDTSTNYKDELKALKLTSAKDYFDDEAELSESDWSSDDEDHLVESIDVLEEEAGDNDKLDEEVVKDGLDKIYMRQLLDDDNQQVTALKEMLLEDGELHSDSGRKRKFQWDEIDEDTAFKKPLFSDNEDENDDALSDDEKSVHWRKERFKRESYLSQKNNSDSEEENDHEESSDNIVQSLVTVVKKTHVVKFEKNENIKMINNTISVEKSDITAKVITKKAEDITQNLNKFVRGSFMKHNSKKMATTLLYMNKKSSINNDNGKSQENSEIKSLTTIVSKAGSNPFAYLLRNQNPDAKNITSDDSINILKKENSSQNKTSTNIQPTEKYHQSNNKKSTSSILKLLE